MKTVYKMVYSIFLQYDGDKLINFKETNKKLNKL